MGWGQGFGDALTAFADSRERNREFQMKAMYQALQEKQLERQQQLAEETVRHNQAMEKQAQANYERQVNQADETNVLNYLKSTPGVELSPEAYGRLPKRAQDLAVTQQPQTTFTNPMGQQTQVGIPPGMTPEQMAAGQTGVKYMTNSGFDALQQQKEADRQSKERIAGQVAQIQAAKNTLLQQHQMATDVNEKERIKVAWSTLDQHEHALQNTLYNTDASLANDWFANAVRAATAAKETTGLTVGPNGQLIPVQRPGAAVPAQPPLAPRPNPKVATTPNPIADPLKIR